MKYFSLIMLLIAVGAQVRSPSDQKKSVVIAKKQLVIIDHKQFPPAQQKATERERRARAYLLGYRDGYYCGHNSGYEEGYDYAKQVWWEKGWEAGYKACQKSQETKKKWKQVSGGRHFLWWLCFGRRD
ncbi:MAG: hypothetical protein ACXABY_35290 [Candidatus Thorarchaeota archaeon]|jgi:opacity protein-like surface antigen